MTKDEVLTRLANLAKESDLEMAHYCADKLILEYLGDDDITAAFEVWDKWYA